MKEKEGKVRNGDEDTQRERENQYRIEKRKSERNKVRREESNRQET